MIPPSLLSVVYGLASAISWGTGDFSGGMASKKQSTFTVVLISQIIGGMLLFVLALLWREPIPTGTDLLTGGTAGVAGMFGLLLLYRGLADSEMGLVAPVTAVVSVIFPLIVGALRDGLPNVQQMLGFALALVAVWLLSAEGGMQSIQWRQLLTPVLAGSGFGLFFVLIDLVSTGVIFWPLIAARCASVLILLIIVGTRRSSERVSVTAIGAAWGWMALSGIFDTGGNVFAALAIQSGRLDIASLFSSLYPAATVMLAWLILKERINTRRWLGIGLILVTITLISTA